MTGRTVCVIGNLNADLVMGPLSDWPAPGTEGFLDRCDFRAGGSAGNTAIVLHRLGAASGLISATGDDTLAAMLSAPFTGPLDRIARLPGRSGITVGVTHPDADRTFLSFAGHLDRTDLPLIRRALDDWPLDGALALVSGGFAMPGLRQTQCDLLDHLRQSGAEIAIDPGWPGEGWTDVTRAEVLSWAGRADHILLNDKEVTGLMDCPDPEQAAARLFETLHGDTCVVVKLGAGGALALGPFGLVTAPATPCAPFDTVGAGDAFNAGYLAALARGASSADALSAGTGTAGAVIAAFPRDTGPLTHGALMKRNILLLIADDLGRMTGCYGDPTARTPNIDRLAATGTRFDNAFASTASCSGSRSTVFTGLHTHQSGQYGLNHGHHHFQTFEDVATLPALLNAAGHATGIIGKVHVGPDAAYPWAWRDESDTRDVDWMARRAAAFLDDAADRPFFLTLGFIDPHRDASRGGFGAPDGPDPVFDPAQVAIPGYLTDLPEVRTELAAYHHAIARMDRGVGLMLDLLAARGLEDDTLVIFLSDNGAPFIHSKTTLFDAGIHLPLILRCSRTAPTVSGAMVSFTDLMATCLDWSGAPAPQDRHHREGRSLLPLLGPGGMTPGWDRVFGSHTFHEVTNYWPTRFLRNRRFKYHRNVAWQLPFPLSADIYGSLSFQAMRRDGPDGIGRLIDRPAEELFDLTADPMETRNIAALPDMADTLATLRMELEDWQRRTGDPWLLRDGMSERALRDHVAEGLNLPDRWDFRA